MDSLRDKYNNLYKLYLESESFVKSITSHNDFLFKKAFDRINFDNPELCFTNLLSFFHSLLIEEGKRNVELVHNKYLAYGIEVSEEERGFQSTLTAMVAKYLGANEDFSLNQSANATIQYWFLKKIEKKDPESNEDWVEACFKLMEQGSVFLQGIRECLKRISQGEYLDIFVNELRMNNSGRKRKLGVVLFCDIEGYTAITQRDESLGFRVATTFRTIIEGRSQEFQGKVIQFYGDGCLILFENTSTAISFAKECQVCFNGESFRIPVRIGLHMGELLYDSGNIFGNVVNIASRIQSLAKPGEIFISDLVRANLQSKEIFKTEFMGKFQLKNVENEMDVYKIF